MLVSEVTRSIAVGDLTWCPRDDRAPLSAWMEERSKENARLHRSQHKVLLYGVSHLEANLL